MSDDFLRQTKWDKKFQIRKTQALVAGVDFQPNWQKNETNLHPTDNLIFEPANRSH
jgi:hypothetical protein